MIYVWATGNGGENHDTCSCDGYVSDIHTMSVGCVSDLGMSTYYSEVCPATMTVVFTGGSHSPPSSKDYRNPSIKIVSKAVLRNSSGTIIFNHSFKYCLLVCVISTWCITG